MYSIIMLFTIGIALSMDTFSLSLSIGTLNIKSKKIILIAIIVGIMHFIMPLLGMLIGKAVLCFIPFSHNILESSILLIIALLMLQDLIKNEDVNFSINFLGILAFAFSVSIDSFITGIGLKTLTDNIFLASSTFAVTSFSFTFLGLVIGKYSQEKMGKIATFIGFLLLVFVAVRNLFN